MKKTLSLLLTFMMICLILPLHSFAADPVMEAGFRSMSWYEYDHYYTLTRSGVLTIFYGAYPDYLNYNGNWEFEGREEITSVVIEHGIKVCPSFEGCENLRSVSIPDSVTDLEIRAFAGCVGLTSIVIPGSIEVVYTEDFYGCKNLSSVTFEEGIERIYEDAFYGCNLTNIYIPSSVNDISNTTFAHNPNIETIEVSPDNWYYYSENNCLIRKNTKELLTGCKNSVIPGDIKSIGFYAFYNCPGLKSITIPKSVTDMNGYGINPFACRDLETIRVEAGNSCYYVENNCLMKRIANDWGPDDYLLITGCRNSVIPAGTTSIAYSAFECCAGLTSIVIPDSVTYLAGSAFRNCVDLQSIVIPGSIGLIEDSTFENCANLQHVVLPEGIEGIWGDAFNGCEKLSSITVPKSVDYIDVCAFDPSTVLYVYDNSEGLRWARENNFSYVIIREEQLADSRVTLSASAFTYNGAVQRPAVSVTNAAGAVLAKDTDYTVSYSAGSKAPGTYQVTVTGVGAYTGTARKSYTIAPQPLAADRVTLSATSFTYNGAVQKPTVTVRNAAGYTMTENSSYTVSYSAESKNPGAYTVTVTGAGYYTGTVTKTYSIASAQEALSSSRVTLSRTGFTYNGAAQQPVVTVKNAAGATLVKDVDYTLAFSSGCKIPGTYTVTVSGKGGYTGSVRKSFTISAQPLDASRVTLSWTTATYNGVAQQPTVTVKNAAGYTMTENSSYNVSCSSDSKYPGSYTLTVTAQGKCYSGTVQKTYTIARQPLNASRVTLSWTSRPYNGAAQKPTVTVKNAAGNTMTKDSSYTVSYSAESRNPGTYTVTVTGKGYYTGTVAKTYSITGEKETLSASCVTLSSESFVYNGAVQKPTVTVKNAAGETLVKDSDYQLIFTNSKYVGQYTVTVKGIGDRYEGTAEKSYAITPQPVSASNVSVVVETTAEQTQQLTVVVKNAAGYRLTKGTSYRLSYSFDSQTGELRYTVVCCGCYTGTVTKTLAVS